MPQLKIMPNSRQIPKTKEICANKKYFDILYAYLQCVSEKDEEGKRYFTKKDINFSKLADQFGLSRQTISTKFKNLKELGLVEEIDKNTYKLVKLMNDTLNDNTISVYVYLFNLYYANGCKVFQFSLDAVKGFIGLSTSARNNNDIVTNILFVLQKIGLIKYSLTTAKSNDNFDNVKTIYQLEWLTNDIKDVKC